MIRPERRSTLLYVATVHYKSPRWIEIQTDYLRRHLSVAYQTWASIEGIERSYATSFDHVLEQRGPHAGKLNHLALEICHVAEDDDLIMFLDGDAFPIADPMPVVTAALEAAPLVAVRRAENANDPQPHPCFCVTTVGTWRSLPGDWSRGAVWRGSDGGLVSDVGGNLLRTLELAQTPWVKLLRSNGAALHSLFFAIYGDIVYHHGAGFRDNALPRVDRHGLKARAAEERAKGPVLRLARAGIRRVRGDLAWNEAIERNNRQSQLVFEAIQRGDSDWLARVEGADPVQAGF
jgi:hypothetical protein